MAKFGKKYKPSRQAKQYAKKIEVAWRSAFDSILEVAKLLNEALEELGRPQWLDLVDNALPFERRMAEKLVKIANDARITNSKFAASMPPRWTTLHELTYPNSSGVASARPALIQDGELRGGAGVILCVATGERL